MENLNIVSPLPDRLLPTVDSGLLGAHLLEVLNRYGFGVLGKSDLEAAILYAIEHSSPEISSADSFRRAELFHITDSRYKSVYKRAKMWLVTPNSHVNMKNVLAECLTRLIHEYNNNPSAKTLRLSIDDEIELRNCQLALQRLNASTRNLIPELSISGRYLILQIEDLDILIKLFQEIGLPPE